VSNASWSDADERPSGNPPTVFLHVGTFKSGTSYLQSVLVRNRDRLAEDGVLFPTGDRKWGAQVRAVRDVLGMKGPTPTEGAWDELVASIHDSPARVAVISMEFLSLAKPATVRKIVDDLRPCQVQVILGARDLVRVMPSAWQSMVKQGHAWSIDEFVASVTTNPPESPAELPADDDVRDQDAHRRFWHHHDLDKIVEVWGAGVGEERIHLLTVPPSGAPPTLLWERFCSILEISPDRYDASQGKGSNFSLSFSDTELMRRINVELRPELDRTAFKRWATRFLANHVMRASQSDQADDDRATLSAQTHDWAVARSGEIVEQIRQRRVQVVGDLDELVPRPLDDPDEARSNEPKVVYPDGAVRMIVELVKRLAQLDPEAGSSPSRRGGGDGAEERGGQRRAGRRRAGAGGDSDAAGRARRARRRAEPQDEPVEGGPDWADEVMYE